MNELALFAGASQGEFMDTKSCSKCGEQKPLSDFYKRSGANSYHSACKACERAMAKDWYERNREKAGAKYREWREKNKDAVKQYRADNRQKHYRQEVVRKYGVEPGWFDAQLAKQKNACACCRRAFVWGDKQSTPHVDHCHESLAIRGILCNRCNTVLGLCDDSADLLSKLARYLRKCHG